MTGGISFMKIKHVIALLLSVLCVSASAPQAFAAEVESDAVYCFVSTDFSDEEA